MAPHFAVTSTRRCPHVPAFAELLSTCAELRTLACLHPLLIVSSSASPYHLLSSCLATADARAGDLAAAESTLSAAPTSPSSITAWNALLAAHSRGGSPGEALRVFRTLPTVARPDSTTFTLALSACARLGDLAGGELVRDRAAESGYRSDIFVCSSWLNLYAKWCARGGAAAAACDASALALP